MSLSARLSLASLALLLIAGCGSSQAHEPASPRAETAEAAQPKRPVPPGQLRREDVLAVLSDGPSGFLQRVEVEPSTDAAGKFRGWKVMAINEPAWADGEVKVGDVIKSINDQSIENPNEFFDLFQSLAFAPELRIDLERNGQPQQARYPINDDPTKPPPPRAELSAEQPPAKQNSSR